MSEPQRSSERKADFVVVPHRPEPLVTLDETGGRDRDELDELIDDLFPDVDEGPGWFDAGLAASGVATVAWAQLGDAPGFVTALGAAAFGLGCILPIRTAWRWLANRSNARHMNAHLAAGVALDASSPPVAALVGSYRSLFGATAVDGADAVDAATVGEARSAAHAALMDVATLLDGRTPSTDRELDYIGQRARALSDLVASLRARAETTRRDSAATGPVLDPDLLVSAREELDQVAPVTSVSRLEELTTEARQRHDD